MRVVMLRILAVGLIVFSFFGCAGRIINPSDGTVVVTKYKKASSSLYYLAQDDVALDMSKTGFYLLSDNLDAFFARIILIQNAKHTLDLQYFIYAEDETAYGITQLLVEAADRGVHVRILIDDLLKKDKDVELSALAKHPNIEIKLFNPTTFRKLSGWLQTGLNLDSLGRRMHNKIFLADNSAVILGGRNIENSYFSADKERIFLDDDILAIGPLAAEASNEFETYWFSPLSKDIQELSQDQESIEYEILRKKLFQNVKSLRYNDYMEEVLARPFAKAALANEIPLVYADAKLYFDIPTKITASEKDTSSYMSKDILPYFLSAKHSIKIVNPYFIPTKVMMGYIRELRARGVEIDILTNSLASNDNIPVYTAYSRYKKELIALGVNLYELNPRSFEYVYKKQKYRKGSVPRSLLHAKSLTIDDEILITGSANLDPRSIKLNTEVVAVIHSKELALAELEILEILLQAKNVFRIEVEDRAPEPSVVTYIPKPKTRIVWITEEDGKEVRYYDDGNAGFMRRLISNLSFYIPLEKYL